MGEPHWLDERELRAWKDFLAVSTILNRQVDQRLKAQAGVTQPQYEVLVHLSEAPGGELRMAELAAAAMTSRSRLTYQVDQLEKARLIRRSSCPTDERGVVAALTEKGWDKLRQTAPGHAVFVRERFIDGLDPATFTGLAEGLRALAGLLDDDAPLEPSDTTHER
jgi:DNA-binding MarR family transcriptional regulator